MNPFARQIIEVRNTGPSRHVWGNLVKRTSGHLEVELECGHVIGYVKPSNLGRGRKMLICPFCEAGETQEVA